MSRARTWTGQLNWPISGRTCEGEDGPEQTLYVTLDDHPDRRVEIRVPLGRLVLMGKRARQQLEDAAAQQMAAARADDLQDDLRLIRKYNVGEDTA